MRMMTNNQWHIVLKAPVEGVHTVIYRYPGASPPVAVATVPQSRVFEYEEFLKKFDIINKNYNHKRIIYYV